MAREMKDSGVEWIGEIPREWETIKNKYMLNIKKAKLPSEFFTDSNYTPYMSMEYIRNPSITPLYAKDGDFCSKEDILLLWDGSNAGEIIFNHPEGFAPSTTAILKQKRNMNKIFFQYYLKFFEKHLKNNSVGMGIPHVNGDILKNSLFLVPPLEEQEKIANYLDKKVSEIDLIIEKTKATIEDYKKYKQSIITEAVTKGINPNVEMKDSRIEWIGEIPKHWKILRIQYLFEVIDERNKNPKAQLLSLYTAIGVRPRADLEEKGNKAVTVLNYKIVKKNDIIVNKLLAWMGAIGYSDYDGVTSPDYDIYRAKNNNIVNRNFYNNYFRYTQFKGECFKYGYGIMLMRWRTYSEQFLRLKVPVPPLEEQNQIAEYLDKKTFEIDTLITKKEALIVELEEYKKSLIYECVTGKREIK